MPKSKNTRIAGKSGGCICPENQSQQHQKGGKGVGSSVDTDTQPKKFLSTNLSSGGEEYKSGTDTHTTSQGGLNGNGGSHNEKAVEQTEISANPPPAKTAGTDTSWDSQSARIPTDTLKLNLDSDYQIHKMCLIRAEMHVKEFIRQLRLGFFGCPCECCKKQREIIDKLSGGL